MSILAVDLGGSHVGVGLVAGSRVVAERTFVPNARSVHHTLQTLEQELSACMRQAGRKPESVQGLAIGYPGIVDAASGEILSPLNKYPDLSATKLREWAWERFGLPVRLENDARLALLGEWSVGAAKGAQDVVMVMLGTGIGGAAMLQGRLLISRLGHAGALGGHLPVQLNGRRCACGAAGCAEAEASTSVLPEICRQWPGFAASSLAKQDQLDFRALFDANDSGDAVAGEVLAHCLHVWSVLAVGLIHAYGPELVLFGGAVLARGEQVLGPIRTYVEQNAWHTDRGLPRVEAATLGRHAALLGAAELFSEQG